MLEHRRPADTLVENLARYMPGPESRDPDLPADLAVGVVQARLELFKRNLDRQAHSGRAQLLDVGLHDVVTPWVSGLWPQAITSPAPSLAHRVSGTRSQAPRFRSDGVILPSWQWPDRKRLRPPSLWPACNIHPSRVVMGLPRPRSMVGMTTPHSTWPAESSRPAASAPGPPG